MPCAVRLKRKTQFRLSCLGKHENNAAAVPVLGDPELGGNFFLEKPRTANGGFISADTKRR
jgi:hypothetical protein